MKKDTRRSRVRPAILKKKSPRSSACQYFGELMSPRDSHMKVSKRKFGQIIDSLGQLLLEAAANEQALLVSPRCKGSIMGTHRKENCSPWKRKNAVANPELVMALIAQLQQQGGKRQSSSSPRRVRVDGELKRKSSCKGSLLARGGMMLNQGALFQGTERKTSESKVREEAVLLMKNRQILNQQLRDLQKGIEQLMSQNKEDVRRKPIMKRVASIENCLQSNENEEEKKGRRNGKFIEEHY